MKRHYDGGSAFPVVNGFGSRGMTLRDYFAAHALQGLLKILPAQDTLDAVRSRLAHEAYSVADAMLAERERKPAP